MTIINSANPGSQINLLCMIYRVIFRNNGKLSIEEITSLCRPARLPTLPDHHKRFLDNLRFWMHDSHQLWKENTEVKLELSRVAMTDGPEAIAVVTNDALFSVKIETIFGRDSHDTEKLFRTLGCIVASDKFTLTSGNMLNNKGLQKLFRTSLPNHIPNDSEKKYVLSYGHFLGFLETVPYGNYIVDPTRIVRSFLGRVFNGNRTLDAGQFFQRLAILIPIIDGGHYRRQVEEKMVGETSDDFSKHRISKALSLAIERLRLSGSLAIDEKSDDPNAFTLQLPDGNRVISEVEYLAKSIER